jgi:hypothetical protein
VCFGKQALQHDDTEASIGSGDSEQSTSMLAMLYGLLRAQSGCYILTSKICCDWSAANRLL